MAAKYHNLAGWCRDLRAAMAAGEELAYEAAELVEDALDLVTENADGDDEGSEPGDGLVADDELVGDHAQRQLPLGGSAGMADQVRGGDQSPPLDRNRPHLAGADSGLSGGTVRKTAASRRLGAG